MMVGTFEWTSTCPFCGYEQQAATSGGKEPRGPQDGDFTICIQCGEWSVFDASQKTALRKPTDAEYEALANDKDAKRARAAWVRIDEERRRQKEEQQKLRDQAINVLNQGSFDKMFESMFRSDQFPPAVQASLRRIFMAGVLTCFERLSRIGDLTDENEARLQWQKLKAEIAEFCVNTISTLAPKKE